jgi:SAM-dependent methyltransferase
MAPPDMLHKGASEGFKNAGAYDTYRPSYPPDAVEAFLKQLGIVDWAHANVVEVAAGTGKFTEKLVDRHENFHVVAVEPHELMREKLSAKDLQDVKVVEGFAAKMPVEDEWGDACIAAQVGFPEVVYDGSSHVAGLPLVRESRRAAFVRACVYEAKASRFSTEEALKEIHRVLKPTSVFGMIWNIEDCKIVLDVQYESEC